MGIGQNVSGVRVAGVLIIQQAVSQRGETEVSDPRHGPIPNQLRWLFSMD
jgi:hypothetical protein